MQEPQWRRIDTTADGKLKAEAQQFAVAMHGPRWGPAHDKAMASYIRINTR